MKFELSAARVAQSVYSRSLLYFVMVAETGSIREASRQLNVAASAVSRQLNHFQQRLGVRLFDNLGHSLRLAPAGEELLRFYQAAVDDLETAVEAISVLHGHRTGTVRIVTVDSFANQFLAELIEGFSRRFPSIHLSISVHAAKEVATLVEEGVADIGFTFNLRQRDLFRIVFEAECPMGIVVSTDHPLAQREIVTYEECVAYPIGLLTPGSSIRAALERASTRTSLPWPKYVEASSMRFLEELARTGRYVTFQPRYRFITGLDRKSLVFVPLDHPLRESDRFFTIVDRRLHLRSAPQEFVSFTESFLAERASTAA